MLRRTQPTGGGDKAHERGRCLLAGLRQQAPRPSTRSRRHRKHPAVSQPGLHPPIGRAIQHQRDQSTLHRHHKRPGCRRWWTGKVLPKPPPQTLLCRGRCDSPANTLQAAARDRSAGQRKPSALTYPLQAPAESGVDYCLENSALILNFI